MAKYPVFDGLDDRAKAFVTQYLTAETRFNAVESLKAVDGGRDLDRTEHTWRNKASQLLSRRDVQAALKELLPEHGIDPEWIRRRIGEIAAKADMADFEPVLSGQKTLSDLREEGIDTSKVKSLKITSSKYGESRSLELSDPLPALAQAMRIEGMGRDNLDVRHEFADLESMDKEELSRLARSLAQEVDADGVIDGAQGAG